MALFINSPILIKLFIIIINKKKIYIFAIKNLKLNK